MSLGRPRLLDDVKRGEICALLNAGLEFHEAARYVGCTPRTIRREIQRNILFRRSVQNARRSARRRPEQILRQAAGRNWRAAAWLLERTNPHGYARRTGPGCSPEDLNAVCRWLIDVAMHEAPPGRRAAMYHRLDAVVRDAQALLLTRSNVRKPLPIPATTFYDLEHALQELTRNDPGALNLRGAIPQADNTYAPADNTPAPFGAPFIGGASQNADSAPLDGGQNSGDLSAQTYFTVEDKIPLPKTVAEWRDSA
jgi:hypothetical protein